MNIPFSPPFIDDDVKQEVLAALESGWITTGPKVKELENEVCGFCNIEAAVAVNSATSGLILMLHWLGVKKNDEVVIPAYTYCATALAVLHAGAKPVMVDVGNDFNADVNKIEQAITSRTKAIILVDFAGWPCNYDAVYQLVNSKSILEKFKPCSGIQKQLNRICILADAAHSFGAVYKNKMSGSLADASVFSFHAVKNLTTAEGGMICLNLPAPFNNRELYKTLRLWTLNGQTKDALTKSLAGSWKYDIVYPGFKMNLPDVLAAIGLAQFRKYKTLLTARKRLFDRYDHAFSDCSWAITPPFHQPDCQPSFHLYPLRIKGFSESQRDEIINKITGHDIAVNVHFTPLPLLTIFKERGFDIEDYPASYQQYANEISLPIYPQLSDENCNEIALLVKEAVADILIQNKLLPAA